MKTEPVSRLLQCAEKIQSRIQRVLCEDTDFGEAVI